MENTNDKTNKTKKSSADENFKFYIHKSYVLSRLLKGSLDEFKEKSLDEIERCLKLGKDGKTVIGRETEYITPDGEKIELDTIFDVRIPDTDKEMSVIVGVEGQNDPNPGYPLVKRAAYYLATMVTAQKGREFNKNYGEMKKTYSIWCVLDPRVADRNTIVRYRMKGERIYGGKENNPQELDAFNIIMINMGKYSDELPDALAIGTAMFSLMEKDARRELVDKKFNIKLSDEDLEKLNDMTHLAQDKYNHGFREGKAEGIAEGKAEGIAEGKAEEKVASTEIIVSGIVSMVDKGMTVDEALSMFTIPEDRMPEIKAELDRRLS